MSKDLPKMYVNKAKENFNNNQNLFSSYQNNPPLERSNSSSKVIQRIDFSTKHRLEQKIYDILNPSKYIYKADVHIVTNDGRTIEKKIIGYVKNNIITYDNEKISIDDIKDLYM